ncbi:alpha/beta hydrolase [Streptomyces sp. NPDC001508]|uniref:alpha/beta hydrolase n=1 Tax=Streptomyces sp. NPDC001508 TaxID=3154656 RepID=UPI0033336DBD
MSEAFTPVEPVLEPVAQAFVEATANPPYLFDLAPADGRKAVDEAQSGEIAKPAVDEEWITVSSGPTGTVRARIVKPAGATGTLPVIIYIHGAGWVFGNAHTHDRLVRELAVGANAAVVFPEYGLSPEARYPIAIEQNWTVAQWVVEQGATKDLGATRIAVAGDSVGGNMTAALTLMAKERGGVPLLQQVTSSAVGAAAARTGPPAPEPPRPWGRRRADPAAVLRAPSPRPGAGRPTRGGQDPPSDGATRTARGRGARRRSAAARRRRGAALECSGRQSSGSGDRERSAR